MSPRVRSDGFGARRVVLVGVAVVAVSVICMALAISIGTVVVSTSGLIWRVIAVMALALTALWPVAYLWLDESPK